MARRWKNLSSNDIKNRITELADEIEQAVVRVLSSGYRTADIRMNGTKPVGTLGMGNLVVKELV